MITDAFAASDAGTEIQPCCSTTARAASPALPATRNPTTLDRERIAHTLALIAIAATSGQDSAITAGVRLAFLRCLPVLLEPPALPAHELDVWCRMLLAISALDGKPAAWFKRLAKRDQGARELLDRLADEELWDLVTETEIG